MYIREDLSTEIHPHYAHNLVLPLVVALALVLHRYIVIYPQEWFEASAVAYTLIVLGSRLARSLVGTPSHPHATSSSFCVSRIVCPVLFCFYLFARRHCSHVERPTAYQRSCRAQRQVR